MAKLYTSPIDIEIKLFNGWINKWCAETKKTVGRPYERETREIIAAYGRTPEQASERLKKKLCEITEKEERKHAERESEKLLIKTETFVRETDCGPGREARN